MSSMIDPAPYRVPHEFLGTHHDRNARRTWMVVGITFVMMVAEIIAGVVYGSMALLADGVHMATHAGALTIAALAYRYARRHQHDSRFAFGTGKVGDLAGFASAAMVSAPACVAMCTPSASSAMEPYAMPAMISAIIMTKVMATTIQVRRALRS